MTESLAAEARRLRMVEGRSVREIQQRLGVGKHRLYEWLRGVPAPQWTRRPNAKDELRSRAEQLRRDGWSVPEIATELGVAKSTAYQWVKHLARDTDAELAQRRRDHSKRMTDARWQSHRRDRDRQRAEVNRGRRGVRRHPRRPGLVVAGCGDLLVRRLEGQALATA
jgi:transposase